MFLECLLTADCEITKFKSLRIEKLKFSKDTCVKGIYSCKVVFSQPDDFGLGEGGDFETLNFIRCKKVWVKHFTDIEARNSRFC
jgi:hypothetical protein